MHEPVDRPNRDRPGAVPTARELLDAMHDVVPERHPAAPVLRAACLLAAVDEWIHRHRAAVGPRRAETRQANSQGIERAARTLRRYLIEGITEAIPDVDGVGAAVAALAGAWVDWRTVPSGADPAREVDTRQALLAAGAAYDTLTGHTVAEK
ncbi:hypothetical protein [Nocardia sp. NPDC049149]|uniref:hypothetical protein n=1 Tax=Nocardia sp. NPDC049149 TaxID=3364315 RepID=UPI0037121757